jgi:fructose-1,6-bisphosphatase II / sedoheptulose-1,7-bisphosphatase
MAGHEQTAIERFLTLELVRVTERAAMAAAAVRGRGDEQMADQAAIEAMRSELNRLRIRGRVVIGEGERDEAPMLYVGEEVGTGEGPEVDIALDPLEGTTICAKNLPNSLSVIAITPRGGLLNVPDVYMDKIAVGPGYPDGMLGFEVPPEEMINRVAKEKGVRPREVSACVLDRPAQRPGVEAVRSTGAAIRLIGDGDVAGVIHTTDPDATGHRHLSRQRRGAGGRAARRRCAAWADRCAAPDRRFGRQAWARRADGHQGFPTGLSHGGHGRRRCLFAATGVTDGKPPGRGHIQRRLGRDPYTRGALYTGTQRWVKARHRLGERPAAPIESERAVDGRVPAAHSGPIMWGYAEAIRPSRHFLDVADSVTGRAWRSRLDGPGESTATAMVQRGLARECLARVLAGRHVAVEQPQPS